MLESARSLALTGVAVAAGVSFVCQQAVNARLREAIGSANWAGFASYLGGTIVMLGVVVAAREPWVATARLIPAAPWWSWLGGAFGAVYVVAAIVLIPRLGAAPVVAGIVVGQMLGSLAFDHFALLGVTRHPITLPRLLGAAFLITGVLLVRR